VEGPKSFLVPMFIFSANTKMHLITQKLIATLELLSDNYLQWEEESLFLETAER
jgi:hypothetical protein